MAKGNEIVVSANPKGYFQEGFINAGETPKPGTIMQIDPTQSTVSGRFVWKTYNRDADGDRPLGPMAVLDIDHLQGKTATDAYAAGDRCFLYIPLPGDELNLLWADADTGTSTNDLSAGTIGIVDDGTGKMIATTGSPETEVAVLLEAISNLSSDTLGWSMWSGQ